MIKYKSRLITITVLFSMTIFSTQAQPLERDKKLIAYTQNLNVSKLDPTLPEQRFENWFKSIVGKDTVINWEINDCGEQTGMANDGSSVNPPLCAEVNAELADSRQISISILVGSHKRGIKGKPTVWMMFVDNESVRSNDLKDLLALLGK